MRADALSGVEDDDPLRFKTGRRKEAGKDCVRFKAIAFAIPCCSICWLRPKLEESNFRVRSRNHPGCEELEGRS